MAFRTPLSAALAAILALGLPLPRLAGAADAVSARLAAGQRSEEDRAQDAGRKPAAVVAFLGIEPGMRVVDLIAAGGWYTEVLSLAVGPEGRVYAQNTKFTLEMRDGANAKAMTARLAGGRLPNVERLDREFGSLGLEPGSIDAALTSLNFHDVYHGRGPEATAAFLGAAMAFLKPGGVLGIIDHSGGVGDDKELHRIDEELAIQAAKQAGFELEATSDVLRNPDDDRTRSVFDESLRGRTDRFVLRLRKPVQPAG